MDADNYNRYQNNIWPWSYRVESDGTLSKDSGIYHIPHADQWYIVFLNMDSDCETTTLTYNVVFDALNDFFSSYGVMIMIGLIGFGSMIGLSVVVILIRKNYLHAYRGE